LADDREVIQFGSELGKREISMAQAKFGGKVDS
jgi:hypothetical protein